MVGIHGLFDIDWHHDPVGPFDTQSIHFDYEVGMRKCLLQCVGVISSKLQAPHGYENEARAKKRQSKSSQILKNNLCTHISFWGRRHVHLATAFALFFPLTFSPLQPTLSTNGFNLVLQSPSSLSNHRSNMTIPSWTYQDQQTWRRLASWIQWYAFVHPPHDVEVLWDHFKRNTTRHELSCGKWDSSKRQKYEQQSGWITPPEAVRHL